MSTYGRDYRPGDDWGRPRPSGQSRQWPRITLTVTGVLLAAVITAFVVRSGGSAATGGQTVSTPRTVVATLAPAPDAAEAVPQSMQQSREVPVRVGADTDGAPQAAAPTDLRTISYTVAGNQRPDDPVTVVYADETGTFQRVDNVTLPWTLTVRPDVPVNYVTATSRGSQLNCWITDAAGTTVAAQTDFTPAATCNR